MRVRVHCSYYTALTRALGRLAGMPPLPALGGGAVRVGSRARALDALQDDYSDDSGGHNRHHGGGGGNSSGNVGSSSSNGNGSSAAMPPSTSSTTTGGDAPYPRDNIPTEVKLAFFNEMRHAYGRTALMLSGGAVLGLYHVGVAKALFAAGLLPRVLSGASAGAIVAATLATKSNEELVATKVFEGEGVPLEFFRVNERSSNGVYLETATLRKTIQGCVGHETFQVMRATPSSVFLTCFLVLLVTQWLWMMYDFELWPTPPPSTAPPLTFPNLFSF